VGRIWGRAISKVIPKEAGSRRRSQREKDLSPDNVRESVRRKSTRLVIRKISGDPPKRWRSWKRVNTRK
jgi:hypothetical protein